MRLTLGSIFILIYVFTSFSQEAYRSEANAFVITFPAGWTGERGSTDIIDVIARDGEKENISINIVVRQNAAFDGITIEQAVDDKFKQTIIDQYTAQFDNFVMLENGITDMAIYKSFYIKYSCDIPAGGKLIAKQYFLINSSKLYIISTGAPEADYPAYEPIFNSTVNSFAFIL